MTDTDKPTKQRYALLMDDQSRWEGEAYLPMGASQMAEKETGKRAIYFVEPSGREYVQRVRDGKIFAVLQRAGADICVQGWFDYGGGGLTPRPLPMWHSASDYVSVGEVKTGSGECEPQWCPDRCPITMRPFFMWLEHPAKGLVPTYGGPFDSYTIPEPDNFPDVLPPDGIPLHAIEFACERYDHDKGAWVEGTEDPGIRVVYESELTQLSAIQHLAAGYEPATN